MGYVPATIGLLGFGIAALLYAAAALLTLLSHPGNTRADWLVAALFISAVWAGAFAVAGLSYGSLAAWLPTLDAVHSAAWVAFLATTLMSAKHVEVAVRLGRVIVAAAAALAAVVLLLDGRTDGVAAVALISKPSLVALLALPLLGLLGLEQIFRNADFEQRKVLRPLSIGIGVIFVTDVAVYSQAVLFEQVNQSLWLLRGFANAVAAPLIVLALKRQPDWERQLFVSRHVVFYATTFMGAGVYLLAMAAGGYIVGATESSWGPLLQILFLACAGLIFAFALFSATIRRRFKVFIAKHFYRNRYDYREEWLRLIETLTGSRDPAALPERSVRALASIVGSERGELWLADSSGSYDAYGAWRMTRSAGRLSQSDVLVRFLRQTKWVVDTREYRTDPEKYANAFVSDNRWIDRPSIFVPLVHRNELIGIVRLDCAPMMGDLSFEDHDLLKTVGQQIAVFLVHERTQEELSHTRQFEAFSKLTAFLMHDLKNLIAQQELVVGNARRFKHRPEFVDDAIRTIESSVQRMRRVLERLQADDGIDRTSRIDVGKLLQDVCASCADRNPAPRLVNVDAPAGFKVEMDREKLTMAVTHAIRNAQDATAATGTIELRLFAEGEVAAIEVRDTGVGMNRHFIENHLFKPFDSTKGAKGMGIGAYQIRETLRAVDGEVEVSSEPGRGTVVLMKLPLAHDSASSEQVVA